MFNGLQDNNILTVNSGLHNGLRNGMINDNIQERVLERKPNCVLYIDAANRESYIQGSTIWNDLSGNANNGTLNNGPSFSYLNNGCIVFDAVNDNITFTNTSSINITGNAITLGAWVWPNYVTSYKQIISKATGTATTARQFGLYITGGNDINNTPNGLGFETRTSNGTVDKATFGILTNGMWNFVCGVYNGSFMYWYLNGRNTGSLAQSGNIVSTASQLFVGTFASGGFSPFDGRISKVFIYNRALTDTEVMQYFVQTKSLYGL